MWKGFCHSLKGFVDWQLTLSLSKREKEWIPTTKKAFTANNITLGNSKRVKLGKISAERWQNLSTFSLMTEPFAVQSKWEIDRETYCKHTMYIVFRTLLFLRHYYFHYLGAAAGTAPLAPPNAAYSHFRYCNGASNIIHVNRCSILALWQENANLCSYMKFVSLRSNLCKIVYMK